MEVYSKFNEKRGIAYKKECPACGSNEVEEYKTDGITFGKCRECGESFRVKWSPTPDEEIWVEMARRKLQFHREEEWNEIKLWGLFDWEDVSHLLEEGLLVTDMKPENVTIWVTPSKEGWESYIKPLIDKYTIEELEDIGGWIENEEEYFDI